MFVCVRKCTRYGDCMYMNIKVTLFVQSTIIVCDCRHLIHSFLCLTLIALFYVSERNRFDKRLLKWG